MKYIRILILEDDLDTVGKIYAVLKNIEEEKLVYFGATVIPDYIQVQEFINKNPQIKFDILLLDRDCYLGGSFHNINISNFDLDKVISISSVPKYNEDAKKMGVNEIVLKDYSKLNEFADILKSKISNLV